MHQTSHLDYMKLALQLAERGRSTVSPNPMVGCVIVKNNQIIGQGFHQRAGDAHAEIHALNAAGAEARDATAYVTLEPCCHFGRTPPCTQALIKAGIKKVVIACGDTNSLVGGKGIDELKAAGIEIETGLCESEAKQLNEIFFHYIKYKRPFVIAKWAMSLDGKIATHPNDSRQISNKAATEQVHQTRQRVDAILVGANTARQDNPLLTARINNQTNKHPLRVILSTQAELPVNLNIFDPNLPGKTLIAATTDSLAIHSDHIEILTLPKNNRGLVDLPSLLDELGKREITSLLVEGGNKVHESFFKENLVNKIQVYLAPTIISSLEKKYFVKNLNFSQLENDFCFTADV